jgi:hypothetical protein
MDPAVAPDFILHIFLVPTWRTSAMAKCWFWQILQKVLSQYFSNKGQKTDLNL